MFVSYRAKGGALLLSLVLLLTTAGCNGKESTSSAAGEPHTTASTTSSAASGGTHPQTSAATTTTTAAGTTAETTAADKPADSSPGPSTTTASPPATTTNPATPADNAAAILAQMTLEEKVGQMFLPHLPDSFAAGDVQTYAPAGFVLYAKDFSGKTKAQVQQMIARYQQASKIPLLISVDEEGGSVVRISSNPALRDTPFLSPQEVYQKNGGLDGLIRDTKEKSRLLLSLGVNLNLAPVCDITMDKSAYIYKRTLGLSAEATAEGIAAMVRTMEQEGISGALKHFPGYGSSTDTHAGIAYDHRDYSEFVRQDFLPFIAGIEQGAPSVLISHNIVTCMDPDYPASLSKEVHRILREELHFDGVIMTDDLSMGAIRQFTAGGSPAVTAVLAGNDLLLTADWKNEYANVLAAVNSGEIPVSRIDESVLRILNWKMDKGLVPGG